MLILSTFTSDYLQKPLQYLLKNFSSETVDIKYTDTNLLIWLTKLHSSAEKNQTITIMFRLIDLIESNKKIHISDLKENINKLIQHIIELKKNKKQALIVALCPSQDFFYEEFKDLESVFLEEMQTNKVHTISQSDIRQHYALTDFDNKMEYETRIPYIFEFYIALACLLTRKLHYITQPSYKVIAVDCDNTLWTGVAGDIGTENVKFEEHNRDLQKFLVKQKENGVFICLCSKNEEETVNNVFSQREGEMILKMSDVALKKINRDAKSSNIKALLNELKLANAKNTMFIDDSEREIDEVSQNLPEIFCVQMPQTIEEFNKIWAFDINECLSVTQTDKDRLKLIQQEEALKLYFSQIKDPIESLKAKREKQNLVISKILFNNINKENEDKVIARIEQIPKRTNQFNLFPFSEYPENEWNIENLIKNDEIDCFTATIQNKLISTDKKVEDNEDLIQGDLTALAVCKLYSDYLLVNGFFLSCRNTGLEVEYALAKHIAIYAKSKNLNKIKFKFKKTEVNKLAETFIDILCQETNKNSIVRFLLKNTKNSSLVQFSLFYLFKKFGILPVDLNKKLNEELIFEFSTDSLTQLDPYLLTRRTMEANAIGDKLSSKRLINEKDLENAKLYLSLLQKETETIEPLVEKFSIGSKFKSIENLNEKVIAKLQFLLPKTKNFTQTISLVHLGLDSLKATYLSASIYEEEKIIVPISKLLSPETTISVLLNYINHQKNTQVIIEKDPVLDEINQSGLPVSLQEQRIFHAEKNEGEVNKFLMVACFSTDELKIDCFKQAFKKMIMHYDIFGSIFSIKKSQLIKAIIPPKERIVNFKYKTINDETELMTVIRQEISQPMSMLSTNGLAKVIIYKVKATEQFIICLCVHHSIFDAYSLNLCLDTLSKFYNAALSSIPLKLPKVWSYQEFTHQNNPNGFKQEAVDFWSKHLSICEGVVEIPSDKSTISNFKPATELRANRYDFELSPRDSEDLKQFATSNGVTAYTMIISMFSILISSYSFSKSIGITTAASGRRAPFLETPGFFVNLLTHAFDLKENVNFRDFVVKNHKNIGKGIEFQDYPFSEIQKILNYNPIQNTALIYQSYEPPELKLNGKIAELVIPKRPIILDMREYCRFGHFTLFAQEYQQKLTFVIEYAKDLFSTSFIEGFTKNLLHSIRNVCKNPDQMLHDISVVCDEERNELISLGLGPQLNYTEDDNLVKRFQHSVEKYPDNIALSCNEIRLSYKEVDQQTTNLVHALIKAGVQQGDYVGIYLEPNHLFFIAELAALKIGAVFIPLSKEDPSIRLKSIIEDANIKFFIVDNNIKGLFDIDFQDCQLISIHSAEWTSLDKTLPPLVKTMEDRFCILYTSGSTGKPKGVILLEKGIFRVVESSKFVKVFPGDKIAQTANQAFDAAQLECWLAWNNGASLVLFDKQTILNTSSLKNKLTSEKITHMWLTAGLFDRHANIQSDLFNNLKYLMVGGDIVYKDTISKILKFEKSPIIINGYGPTETSIFALTYTFNKQILNNFVTSPIGTPVNNTTVKILTPLGALAPIGAIGELLISGDGVGSYLNLPELEKERFIGNLEKREFLTGDLVKWNSKYRQMMYEARATKQQVKINGNLVNLEEVGENLSKHPAIKQVKIIIKKLDGFNKLIAFYSLNEGHTKPTNDDLYHYLKKRLSSYLIPAFYVQVDTFLTNANGKLDVKWLEEYQLKNNDNDNSKKIEGNDKTILEIFKKELANFPDNIEANFFAWGGSSIQAVTLISKINDTFKEINLLPSDLYEYSTVAGLASLIKNSKDNIKNTGLRLLKKGDDNLPTIVFIHPAGGGISCFDKLIQKSYFDNSCYGIEDPLLHSNHLKLLPMEHMASNYYYEIINNLKTPIVLVGFSFGGLLACEIATLFESKSENNDLLEVVLFDTWVVANASDTIKEKLIQDVLIYCAKQREEANVNGNSAKMVRKLEELCEHHQEIGFKFTPKKLYSTPVSLFKAINLDEKFSDMNKEDKNNFLLNFLDIKLFKKFEIEATHYDLLETSANNYLNEFFSNQINEINKRISSKCSKLNKVSMTLFRPLSEINNDPQFSCLKPRIKQ